VYTYECSECVGRCKHCVGFGDGES